MKNTLKILLSILSIANISFAAADPPVSCALLRINLCGRTDGIPKPADAALIGFDAGFSDQFDHEDARKVHLIGPSIGIVNTESTLSVEKRTFPKANERILLKVQNLDQGNYQINASIKNIENECFEIIIHDSFLDRKYPLFPGVVQEIQFQVTDDPGSCEENRFRILFEDDSPINNLMVFNDLSTCY